MPICPRLRGQVTLYAMIGPLRAGRQAEIATGEDESRNHRRRWSCNRNPPPWVAICSWHECRIQLRAMITTLRACGSTNIDMDGGEIRNLLPRWSCNHNSSPCVEMCP